MNDANESSKSAEGEVGLVSWQDFHSPEPYTFVRGGTIPGFTLRYETYGKLSANKDNVILILHAISGDHHCAGVYTLKDRKPGWWNHMIGPGKPIDTNRFFVIASNCLGGCQGSTGPSSINPDTGKRYNLDFPEITIRDLVRTQKRLFDHLGIERLYAVIGGSMGGMQTLQWAVEYPDMVERMIPLATTARENTQAIAFNAVGRAAITDDPDWQDGDYPPEGGPNVGLAIARMMAHITYLSDVGLEEKFGRDRKLNKGSTKITDIEFEVESYLHYQGSAFVNRFDANTYLYLTKALDRFDLYGPQNRLEDAFEVVKARSLVVGFSSDWLFPPHQNRDIAHALLRCGKRATYAEVAMQFGHDSFLVHVPQLFDLIRNFLKR